MELTLQHLQEQLKQWDGCELAKTANPVLGEGNPNADIMFIGEAPGKKEDELGRPFVGASGKFLNTLIESIDIQRSDVYISNIVKYRPPNNRDPTVKEKEECIPWLQLEISIVKPKIIVPLGRHSLGYFLPRLHISQTHGTAHLWNDGVWIFPLYHPAAALYNGSLRQTLFDDFQKLKEFLEKEMEK